MPHASTLSPTPVRFSPILPTDDIPGRPLPDPGRTLRVYRVRADVVLPYVETFRPVLSVARRTRGALEVPHATTMGGRYLAVAFEVLATSERHAASLVRWRFSLASHKDYARAGSVLARVSAAFDARRFAGAFGLPSVAIRSVGRPRESVWQIATGRRLTGFPRPVAEWCRVLDGRAGSHPSPFVPLQPIAHHGREGQPVYTSADWRDPRGIRRPVPMAARRAARWVE